MPIQKFRTFEEAEHALWNLHPDIHYYRRVAELWNFAAKLRPMRCERGVSKFKTWEEANRGQEESSFGRAVKP